MYDEHYLEFCLVFSRLTMEAGKQQVKPIMAANLPEIQPAFKDLDIGQLGKTLTVGNLLDWQRTVVQAVENAKSGGTPISLIPVTTTFQPANMVKPFITQKATIQAVPAAGIATSVPVIKATNAERVIVPESKPFTSMLSSNYSGSMLSSGTVLNSMLNSLIQPSGTNSEEAPTKSPNSSQGQSMAISRSPAVLKYPVVSSTSSQQVTNNITTPIEAPTTSNEATQNISPPPPSKSLFKLSGRTLVTILPSGSGEGKSNTSHKVFGDDAFTPIDSFGAGAFEAGSPSSEDAKTTEKITLSPKEVSCGRSRNESAESNTNKNNNNSTPSQSVKVKQENGSGDYSGNTTSSKKGKTSSRGRNIKNTGVVYTETSDFEDDDVFLHNSSYKQKSSKSKRSRQTITTTTIAIANNDASESDQEGMQANMQLC